MTRGFTLIELLVAMTLLALISVVLFGGLRLSGSAAGRVEARADALESLRLSQSFVRRHLAAARPVVWIVDRAPVVAFAGRPGNVDFIGELPDHLGAAGRQAMRLSIDEDAMLLLTWRPLADGDRAFQFDGARRHRLFQGQDALRFDYFGRRPATAPPRWHDTWLDADALPALIRIRSAAGGWPTLIVATVLDPGLR